MDTATKAKIEDQEVCYVEASDNKYFIDLQQGTLKISISKGYFKELDSREIGNMLERKIQNITLADDFNEIHKDRIVTFLLSDGSTYQIQWIDCSDGCFEVEYRE